MAIFTVRAFYVLGLTCIIAALGGCSSLNKANEGKLPAPGEVTVDRERCEVLVPAVVQHPAGKPCIDDWGQRPQAFAGCRYAAGGEAKFAEFFVFLADVETEQVYDALIDLGARPRLHCTMAEGKKRSGLTPATTAENYLQGDAVVLSVLWKEDGKWRERPYDDFAQEKVVVNGGEVIKPWTPHFVFHGSGAIHSAKTGCIACPCDCPGGIIADNRYPIYNPKPMVRFDWDKCPSVGTRVYVRIRPVCSS